ncbi:MAG: ribosome silencing factor [Candidatus Nanopelagicales bacterium]|jgi:ribosome-associated protein|nr:ribosome silencing factor [Candidatus Nanopelagicales bacterium]MCU0295926.1 ribosome silencing factor [Candidatus Nanopelagicales bacterium]
MTISTLTRNRVQTAAQAAFDTKAEQVRALDVSEHLALTDAFLICSGSNERQVDAIVDAIERTDLERPLRREGKGKGRWVLLDFGDFVVHVQHAEERAFYDLERLWKDCPQIEVEDA